MPIEIDDGALLIPMAISRLSPWSFPVYTHVPALDRFWKG